VGKFCCEVPEQELLDAVDGVIGDTREHVLQVALGIEVVQLGGGDQDVDRSGQLTTGVGSRG